MEISNSAKYKNWCLIEPDGEELAIPSIKFSSVINLPSTDFQKIIRDLSPLSDKLEIRSVDNELIFKCTGAFAQVEISRTATEGTMEIKEQKDSKKIIQGMFSLKNLYILLNVLICAVFLKFI